MIYFFDINLKLKKIVTPENALEAVHEHELNNHILGSVTMDMDYTKQFIDDVDHFGYYYKGNFYLHRIRRVEDSHINETVTVTGRHIFFEDMLYGLPIDYFRPQNRDAAYILKNTIDTNTRWRTVMTDVTGTLSTNFYRQVPWDVIEWVTENFRVEFEPVILFDGQKINGYQLHVANKLGVNKHKRIPFSRVTELDYEIDYSEIITSLAGYGKGEEVGEGHGRRINIADVDFSRNGVVSPIGSHYMEDANITALYGKDNGEPKYGIVEFPDIEDDELLAEAMYESYLEMSRPKMVFSASVIDVGDVGIGDTQVIVRPEYDVFYSVRLHKMIVNLNDPEDADVELGDYEHFKESKVERKSRRADKEWKKRYSSAIEQMKRDWDADYEGVIEQIEQGYEQAVIDANANIQAAEVRMQEELSTQRTQMEQEINQAEENAINEATQNAETKKQEVLGSLSTFKDEHQQLYDDLKTDVINIDDFLGDARDIPLDQRLLDMTAEFNERLSNASRSASNMIRGSRFDESSLYTLFYGASIQTSEDINFTRLDSIAGGTPIIRMDGELHLHAGVEYHLHLEYRTDAVTELDGFVFYHNDGTTERLENRGLAITGLTTSGAWEHASMTLTPNAEMSGRLALGTRRNYGTSPDGIIDVRLPYLTATAHEQWLPHPLDANQNIEDISRRITQLEDGYSEFIVRSEWDAEMNNMTQTIRDYKTTVDGVEDTIIELENSDLITRGREVLDTVDGFQRKVWLGDIDNANLIPHADVVSVPNRDEWSGSGSQFNGAAYGLAIIQADSLSNYIGMESPHIHDYVTVGETYTVSWIGQVLSGYELSDSFDYVYLTGMSGNNIRLYDIQKESVNGNTSRFKYTATFTMPDSITESTRILFGVSRNGDSGGLAYVRFGEPKLELGDRATPFHTSFSMLEHRADEINLAIQGIGDNGFLTESDIQVRAGYVQLGSQRLGDEEFASIFRVSPQTIDVVTEQMRLSGDLYVDGDIEALALSAIDANFARVQTAILKSNVITSDMVGANVIQAEHIFVQNAMIEDIVNTNLFTDTVNAMSINAVYADLRSVNSEIMTSNIIKSNWLNVDTALFNRFTASTAFIESLTAKTVFARDVQAITMDAVQANLTTVMNSMGEVEGGLTIRRPDGAVYIQNGQARGHVPVQLFDSYSDDEVGFTGLNWYTQSSHWKTFKYFYTPHEGSRLRVTWALDLYDGPSNIEYMEVRVRTFTDYKPINMGSGESVRRATLNKSEGTVYVTQDIPMPPPNYNMMAAYLEFRRAPDGQSTNNRVQARILHIGQYE